MRTAFINARLIDPERKTDCHGGLLLDYGRIKAFGPEFKDNDSEPGVSHVIDCQGKILCPGLIDSRVHCREPGEEQKENFQTASMAAVKGGITTIIQRADTKPAIDGVAMVEHVKNSTANLKGARIYPIAALTKNLEGKLLSEIGLLQKAGALAFGDGDRVLSSPRVMRRALGYAKNFNALILQFPQEAELSENGMMNAGALATRLGLTGFPPLAEILQVERDLRLLQSVEGAKLHFSLITTKEALMAIAKAKAQGLDVTCDTAPHYFMMNENDIGDYLTFTKTFPPLRHEDDRKALKQAIGDGVIDIIVSDHNPQDRDSKRLPYSQAEFGVVGLETLLCGVLSLYHDDMLNLVDALSLVTINPAKRYGLNGGRFTIGEPADITIIDADYAWKLRDKDLSSKSTNTAFNKREMQGKALYTMVKGEAVYIDNRFHENIN